MPEQKAKCDPLVRLEDPGAAKVLEAAQNGDTSSLPTIRSWITDNPGLVEGLGNLSRHVEQAWTKRVHGENLLGHETLSRKLESLKKSLEGPRPSPLETLLVERIAACWLQVNYFDSRAGQANGGQTIQQVELELKRQQSAQRRYLAAIRTLAEVRKLLGPTIQVNIAEQQVNVAGG